MSKAVVHWFAVNYREAYGTFISNGHLFNHESPLLGETFVTCKISRALGRTKTGLQDELSFGNLEGRRDWGFAGDYVEAMWRMPQQDSPGDSVVASGEAHSVREFLDEAASLLDIDSRRHVEVDARYFRPAEVDHLPGDASKARDELARAPTVGFRELVRMMVDPDLEPARQEKMLRDAGHRVASQGPSHG